MTSRCRLPFAGILPAKCQEQLGSNLQTTAGLPNPSYISTAMVLYHVSSLSMLAVVAVAAATASDADAEDVCGTGVLLLQKGLHVQAEIGKATVRSKPWDTHLYFVGTHHKSGSQLLRNIMKWAFDYLGANYSCQEHLYQHATITTEGGQHKCKISPDCRIHWDNSVTLDVLQRNRELAGEDGLKVAHSVRDPKVMLASSYCYHHRGEEYGNPIAPWPEIMTMGPLEGMFAVFPGMMRIFDSMVGIYNNSGSDVYNSHYEDLTASSDSFDDHVGKLYVP